MKRFCLFFWLVCGGVQIQSAQQQGALLPAATGTEALEKEQKSLSESQGTFSRAKEYVATKLSKAPFLSEELLDDAHPMAAPGFLVWELGSLASRSLGLALGGNPNVKDATGLPFLAKAINDARLDIAYSYLGAGANPNTLNRNGEPILITALKKGWVNFATELLKTYHANPNVEFQGMPALGYALAPYHTKATWQWQPDIKNQTSIPLIKLFIDSGADVNKPYSPTESLLAHAANNVIAGDTDSKVVKMLLYAGATPDQGFLDVIKKSAELEAIYAEYLHTRTKTLQEIKTTMEAITPGSTAPMTHRGEKTSGILNIIGAYTPSAEPQEEEKKEEAQKTSLISKLWK